MLRSITLLILSVFAFGAQSLPKNRIDRLQEQINAGEVKLEFDQKNGYLRSLLKALKIPVESQMLVFSKTSFQRDLISPERPRAVYFNDDTYVGWVPEAPVLEISVADPVSGAVFYSLSQDKNESPQLERRDNECAQCHGTGMLTDGLPGHMMRSVFTDPNGAPLLASGSYVTSDQSPLTERWGGWFFTGSIGRQQHMGTDLDMSELGKVVEKSRYLTPHSDVVAMMVLAHQTRVHNWIAQASEVTRMILDVHPSPDGEVAGRIKRVIEPVVSAMLFAGETRLNNAIAGTSGFPAQFEARGPFDRQGRSLRQFDLKTRLFRYPCSYLIYSEAFETMPALTRQYIYQRMREILLGQDHTQDFAHLTPADRKAILEILKDTKPDFTQL
jgi:hypothetical protein